MADVLLLFGGRSAEHEVSCVSAVAIVEALTGAGHRVVPIGIDRGGGWHLAEPRPPFSAEGPDVSFHVPEGVVTGPRGVIRFDVVFPVLHGPYGEDGTIQGMLDMAGVPYVGASVLASAVGMDKDVSKRLFQQAGIPTIQYEVVRRHEWDAEPGLIIRRIEEALGLPVFVKPARLGSSVGVARAGDVDEMKQSLEEAFNHGSKALVEECVRGREIEVGVIEGPRVSVPGEIVIEAEWYSYDAKYNDERSRFVTPADLTEEATATVRDMAARAFQAIEGLGLARVDFFYEEGGRGFLINEVNTMPGFTPISGFPAMWQASGMSYPELCDELVRIALERG